MAGIPTSNILQPGNISITGGVNRALISQLQILKPALYQKYTEKYGDEMYIMWLQTYAGMEKAINQTYTWAENRGKLMPGIGVATQVAGGAAGSTVTVTLSAADHYNAGTQSPLRVNETLRVASSNIEGVILTIDTTTPNAFTFTVRPKKSTQSFVSAGSTNLLAGEILKFGGYMDAGEASSQIEPLIHLDQTYSNNITEMREDWAATDLAEMAEVFYSEGVSGTEPAGGTQAGYSYFTYKGLVKSNTRYVNNIEDKLMFGDTQNNTGLSNSLGTQGMVPKIIQDGETIGMTPGTVDLQKLHEITRIMDVNGCAKQNLWLQDIFLRQAFTDGIFKEFPAGAWVWGKNESSEDAAIAYGVQSMKIDEYLFMAKKYKKLNTEVTTGKTPTTDYFRNSGIIVPMGSVQDAKDSTKTYKNVTIMYQDAPGGGTQGNGIRVWQWGGGSRNPTDGTMRDHVSQITYRGMRICGANQFIFTQAS